MTPSVLALAAVVGFGPAARALPAEPTPGPTRQVVGVLEEVDFIHRTGRFRDRSTGVVTDFALLPSAAVLVRNADADLRDLPLGRVYEFTLRPDADARFTRVVALRDRFTSDARQGIAYRVEAVDPAAGTVRVTPRTGTKEPVASSQIWRITGRTRFRKGDKAVALGDLSAGDEIVAAVDAGELPVCTDVWVDAEARKRATDEQLRKHVEFVKARGLAGRVERTSGRTLTISLFGDPATFSATWARDFVADRDVHVAVANDELRTWNPPVDQERARVVEVGVGPAEPGLSGVRLTVVVNFMLEGFRKGRVVRVFGPGWRVVDQPFGEQLFHYGARAFPPDLAENPAKEYPDQYPFRTDFGNTHLPWYRLTPGTTPPPDSEHRVFGELKAVSPDHRSGKFRADGGGDEIAFQLLPAATVRFQNAEAGLADIPLGTRCGFHMYQDDSGAFRRAGFVTDEVSELVKNGALWRVESIDPDDGTLVAARQPPGVKNDQGDPEQPSDVGRTLLRVEPDTRIRKGDKTIARTGLAVGDLLIVNRTGDRPGQPSRCTDVWVGAETHKQFTDPRPKKSSPPPQNLKGTPR